MYRYHFPNVHAIRFTVNSWQEVVWVMEQIMLLFCPEAVRAPFVLTEEKARKLIRFSKRGGGTYPQEQAWKAEVPKIFRLIFPDSRSAFPEILMDLEINGERNHIYLRRKKNGRWSIECENFMSGD